MHRAAEISNISVTANIYPLADFILNSWFQANCYDLDFNLGLGKAEAVRSPYIDPVEGLFYLMPRRLDDEIADPLCLRDEDVERLRGDREFAKYAVYIG